MGEPNEKQDITSAKQEDTSENLETFTKEQVEEAGRKGKSDALAEIGRLKTSAENAIKAAKGAGERLDRMLREQEETELEVARDEPDKLTAIRSRQTLRQKATDLDERERKLKEGEDEHAEALKEVVESTKEHNAREIATRLNVETKTLVKLAKFTDGSPEAIEDIAKDLPKKGETTTLKPDSGKTIGGGSIPTNMEQFKKWIADIPQEEFEEKYAADVNKMMKAGKIK